MMKDTKNQQDMKLTAAQLKELTFELQVERARLKRATFQHEAERAAAGVGDPH